MKKKFKEMNKYRKDRKKKGQVKNGGKFRN